MPTRRAAEMVSVVLCACSLALPGVARAQSASDRCPALPAPAAPPAAGRAPVAYDIELHPDFATGRLRERARVAIRNPDRADSIVLTAGARPDSVVLDPRGWVLLRRR